MKRNRVSIGTRGSKLALYQAEWVKTELQKKHPGIEINLIKVKTMGDKVIDVPLAKIGGKGLFVKEIEEALLRHKIDLAVHSMKDVPTDLPEGLHLAAICKRENPRDALIISHKLVGLSRVRSKRSNSPLTLFTKGWRKGINKSLLYELAEGSRVGTSSLRRSCQLRNIRPDFKIEQLRGNLDTRLRKLDEGQFDAIIVAVAGIKRLGFMERITEILEPEICLPAIGQGAIGIECRVDDKFINTIVGALDHKWTAISVRAERAFLRRLEGGCQVPIAAYARIEQRAKSEEQRAESRELRDKGIKNSSLVTRHSSLIMDGLVASITGGRVIKGHMEGRPEKPEALGIILAEDLLARGAREILAEVYRVS
jgi:hydroxymethylbilane synthase